MTMSVQQKRHQFLANSSHSMENRASASASTADQSSQLNGSSPYPTDTPAAIHYLLSLLCPQQVRQQKSFPRVCMVHQLYSIIHDNTAVDRTLANLIKENTIRKFYLGGTGSDEFAIMLTSDYVAQIQQAKEQYLVDLQQQSQLQDSSPRSPKRKSDISVHSAATKKVALNSKSTRPTAPVATRASKTKTNALSDSQEEAGEIFDRFKELVISGHCMEISIQHSNIQSVMGATDQDITTLIRYSLLNRSLSQPANPHLIDLNRSAGRGTIGNSSNINSSSSTGNVSGDHSALNQLIHSTNQEHAKAVKSETTVSSVSSASPSAPTAATTISATLGRQERVSDDVAYRFAIRQGGLFVTHFLKGRLEILRMIRRQMFGDMLTSAIIAKPLRGSFLPHEFHIHDIVGSGRVQSITTTSGLMLKLTQKGEASAKAK